MNTAEIDREVETITARLSELRAERGKAVLVGQKFTGDAEIARLESRKQGLLDARSDADAAARAAAEEAHRGSVEAQRGALLARVRGAEERRLEAIARAEAAGRELGAALAEAFAAGDEIAEALSALHSVDRKAGAFDKPRSVNAPNRQAVAGQRIALMLSEALDLRRLGGLSLGHSLPAARDMPSASWREAEADAMRAELIGLGWPEILTYPAKKEAA